MLCVIIVCTEVYNSHTLKSSRRLKALLLYKHRMIEFCVPLKRRTSLLDSFNHFGIFFSVFPEVSSLAFAPDDDDEEFVCAAAAATAASASKFGGRGKSSAFAKISGSRGAGTSVADQTVTVGQRK